MRLTRRGTGLPLAPTAATAARLRTRAPPRWCARARRGRSTPPAPATRAPDRRRRSLPPPLVLVEKRADVVELLRVDLPSGERALEQSARRPVEGLLQDRRGQLALCHAALDRRLVDVRAEALGAGQQALLVHHLHLLQHGRVADVLGGGDHLEHFAHRAGAALPQDTQDAELGFGRCRLVGDGFSNGHASTLLRQLSYVNDNDRSAVPAYA